MSFSRARAVLALPAIRSIAVVLLVTVGASCSDAPTRPSRVNGPLETGAQPSFAQAAQELRITPANDTILIGQNFDLTVANSNGSAINKQATWVSSDTTIAKVVATGVAAARVTGRRTGVVTITAQSVQKQGTNKTTVVPVPVRSVSVSPDTISIQLPDSVQYIATARDSVGNVLTGRVVTWSVADTSVALISPSGVARPQARGTTRVLATVEGVVGFANAFRVRVPELSATLSLPQDSANAGDTLSVAYVARNVGDAIQPDSLYVRIGLRSSSGVVISAVRRSVPRAGLLGPYADAAKILLPWGLAPGAYSVAVYVDCKDVAASTNEAMLAGCLNTPLTAGTIPEGNENDNSATVNVVVRGPDFVALGVTAPDSILKGAQATTSIQITNAGSATSATFNVISALYDATAGTYPIAIAANLSGLGSRENRSIPFLFGVPQNLDPTHVYQVVAYVDCSSAGGTAAARIAACFGNPMSAGVVAEANENNNSVKRTTAMATNVVRVTLTPDSVALGAVGDTTSLLARAFDRSGNMLAGATMTWTSLDPSIVDVLVPGKVIARAFGRARIVATSDGFSDTSIANVVQTAARVVVAPDDIVLQAVGDTARLSATVYDASNNVMPGAAVSWTVSQPIVADVSPTGLVTARASGTSRVIATSGNRADTASVTVFTKVTRVVASPDSVVIEAFTPAWQYTAQLYATSYDKNGNVVPGAWVTWQSLDPSVATVTEHGGVAAHANGQARITATNYADGVADTVLVVVNQRAAYIQLTPETTFVAENATATITPILRDSLGNEITTARVVTWTSLDPSIATVNGTSIGQVIGVRAGVARVVGTIEWRADTVVVVVTAASAPEETQLATDSPLRTQHTQRPLREPRDDVQVPVDHFADVVLHRGAHDDRDFAARKLVILLEPLREARRCGAECLVERTADS